MQDASNIISNVGFPIFCVLALGFFIYKAFNTIIERNNFREERLYSTIEAIRDQLRKASEVNASFVQILSDFRSDMTDIQTDVKEIKAMMGMNIEKGDDEHENKR